MLCDSSGTVINIRGACNVGVLVQRDACGRRAGQCDRSDVIISHVYIVHLPRLDTPRAARPRLRDVDFAKRPVESATLPHQIGLFAGPVREQGASPGVGTNAGLPRAPYSNRNVAGWRSVRRANSMRKRPRPAMKRAARSPSWTRAARTRSSSLSSL